MLAGRGSSFNYIELYVVTDLSGGLSDCHLDRESCFSRVQIRAGGERSEEKKLDNIYAVSI